MPSTCTAYIGSASVIVAFAMSHAFSTTRSQSWRRIFMESCYAERPKLSDPAHGTQPLRSARFAAVPG